MSTAGGAVGGLVGGIAGFFLGGPTGALYGAQLGMMVGGYLDPPKGPTVNGPRLNDLTVQTSTYGAVIPRVYGTVTVNGNVLWLENNTIKETITKKKSGGKGGGSKTTTRNYTYSATFAVGLCKGPIVGIRRLWVGADLIYDAGSTDPDTIVASNQSADGWTLYTGTDIQSADARMQATLGAGNTPAWRGLAYLVFEDLPLEKYGNSLMGAQVRAEVFTAGTLAASASARTLPLSDSWGAIACSPTKAVSIVTAYTSSQYVTSADGDTWTARSVSSSTYYDICYGGGMFLMVSSFNSCQLSTDDGLTFSVLGGVPFSGSSYKCAAYGGGKFTMLPSSGTVCCTSSNGTVWTSGTLPNSRTWSSVCHNGTFFCAVAQGTNICATSTDGLSWTEHTMANSATWKKIIWNGTIFCAVGNTVCNTSPDGISWTTRTFPNAYSYYEVAAYGGYFLFVGFATQALFSADCITWQTFNMPAYGEWDGLCVFQSGFLAVLSGSSTAAKIVISASGVAVTLSSIISSECVQSGLLTSGDIDVTALTQSVRGYRIGSVGAIRSALKPLQAAWPFDVRQHGYKIQFVARGGVSVVTIPAADLDARGPGDSPGVQITTSREMDSQMPSRVTVQHLDYDREYNTGSQYAERLNTAAINAQLLDLPIVLTATEAAGKAEVLLYLYWLERYDVAIILPPTYLQLEPGDVVTLVTPEGNVSLRLVGVTLTSDGRVEGKAKYASAAIYTPTAVGASPAVTGPVTLTPVGASVYVLLDIPEVSSAQNTPCFLAAMTGALTGWRGGALMQSTDSGGTWNDLHDFGAPGCTIGTATNAIGAVDTGIMDNSSQLSVTLSQGSLYSVTQLAMFGGANYFAYGASGRWEIVAAMTATFVSGSSYTLSNFLRGRVGTEQYMAAHVAGDSIVLLDTLDVALIEMGYGTIGLSYLYRGITVDRDISTDSDRAFSYQGVNLRPLSPIYLTGNRDSSNDWVLTWIRRTRDGGEWRDNVDAALGEASEAYQIDIYTDGTYATVKRTISTTEPSAAYTAADQTADFGSTQATLYLKIYQISAIIGRGYPLTQSITR